MYTHSAQILVEVQDTMQQTAKKGALQNSGPSVDICG